MRHFLIASLLVSSWTSVALAEGPEGAPPPQQPPPGQAPPPGQQQYEVQPTPTYQQGQQPQAQGQGQYQEQPVTGQEGRGIEYGLHLLVPVWLTMKPEDGDPRLNPGFGLQGRVGWEFGGGVTAEINVGVMWNGLQDVDATLNNVWIGGGGRYMFFNPSAFVPFIGAGIKLNLWDLCDVVTDSSGTTSTECGGERKVTIGFQGTVGAAYEISPDIAIEFGLNLDSTLAGDVFNDAELYISPFAGGTLYF